jgi:hypothetical protein
MRAEEYFLLCYYHLQPGLKKHGISAQQKALTVVGYTLKANSNLLVMKKVVILIFFLRLHVGLYSQSSNTYEVYAIQFGQSWFMKLSEAAVRASDKDSIEGCNMFWLLKGKEKIILVDAGFLKNEHTNGDHHWDSHTYIRPDSALLRMNRTADDITDIILSIHIRIT